MDDNEDIVREFLVESYENLDQLDRDLVELEGEPGSRSLLSSIFRTVHTIKGTSGFLGFGRLERVTHVGESLLVELRDGKRQMDQRTTDVLLTITDTVREILGAVEKDGSEGDVDVDEVVAAVEALRAGVVPAPAPVAVAPPVVEPVAAPAEPEPVEPEPAAVAEPMPAEPEPEPVAEPEPPVADVVEPPAKTAPAAPAAKRIIGRRPADQNGSGDSAPALPEQRHVPTAEQPPAAAPAAKAVPADDAPAGATRGANETSIRVDVEVLDSLMRQVGELVLARNQITRLAQGSEEAELVRASQRLNLIAGELQEGVMKTRMQPIEHVWSKMPRVVRDLAASCGREVVLEMTGKETELDRSLLEAVKDPLTHLVRNAVDHGVEPADVRIAAGKPAKGVLSLRAYHAGGQVVVEVADDGRGIDPAKVAEAAVAKGVRTAAQVAGMSPADLLQLLFLPGFSTAEKVTKVSGRGVGMDVVRTKIEGIGGTVDVESTLGKGTVWRLRIPLTLAIMPTLTVACAGDLYAVPQVNLLELVALDSSRGSGGIEYVHAAPVYRLRGELLPLVGLREALALPGDDEGVTTVIAVVQADGRRFGLLVDQVLNTEEIVVKPLSARLKAIGVYAGATVLGDGRVALILDVQAIARRALPGEPAEKVTDLLAAANGANDETEQVLVVGVGTDRRVAMPLASVARLEHLRTADLELVGGREVVQYRDTILPLMRLGHLLGAAGAPDGDELLVVVYSRAGRSVGLVVDEILDIVDDHVFEHSDVEDSGLLGSTVLGGRVTELLDVQAAILAVDPTFYDDRAGQADVDAAFSELVGATR
ncbi:MAG: chemotaxis protein CheA [Cellulomonas sp.]|nr:chemotaxis protein CheA [Cellulomonas sp.]